ncbi:uncharacterized protein [Rutidosis leptorrhynchoides]|uniref:uncharacterized protein n=1 Tax=Rutidosis leptorrhynchoides TaxID=125765 RepID=UPI003A98F541
MSEHLAKLALELEKHEINFAPRNAVKGQIMVDFLIECTANTSIADNAKDEQPEPLLELYTNGASGVDGTGTVLILTGHEGEEHTYALRFGFSVSNDENEYEALLSGLRIAVKLGIKSIKVYVDSQLVANQMNGAFKARDPAMQMYLKITEGLANQF